MKTRITKIIIPLIIILGGIAVMKLFLSHHTAPVKSTRNNQGILVEVEKAKQTDIRVPVTGTGTVRAVKEITVSPQVSGQIIYTAPNLVQGGFFKEGEILFAIDDRDYTLAIEKARSAQAKAEYELTTIQGQAQVARAEWDRINKDRDSRPNPLVVYEPQLKSAQAALAAAEAGVKQAMLNLERTKVTAPFNAIVRTENIDTGQYVTPGKTIAVLAGTDMAEIAVSLLLSDLQWVHVPGPANDIPGDSALVELVTGSKSYTWTGLVTRTT